MQSTISSLGPATFIAALCCTAAAQETLRPLLNGEPPRTHSALWADYDPQKEPIESEVMKEWEEDGVVLQVVRFRTGVFKGKKALMAGVYGFPKNGDKVPGLVQIHGGGQYADYRAPLVNAKRGYATISIAWAGRINAPEYRVSPEEVSLFWNGETDNSRYRVTTDWGALDAYHAPTRSRTGFGTTKPSKWTLDNVDSVRNNPWFLCTLGARRAITFLEQQPVVDRDRIGVYGHSMGGKLTVLTAAADRRIKAAVPSCGGVSERSSGRNPTEDDVSLEKVTCPILFQSPANDFHGRINDLQKALREIQTSDWRVTCSPHHNHQDTSAFEVASQLWFDQHLKGDFQFPDTPKLSVNLGGDGGVPSASIKVDAALPVLSVDVFYSRHGREESRDDRDNTVNRFWHHAAAKQVEGTWHASLPLGNTLQPLWVYANVRYRLATPVDYAGYYYRVGQANEFSISSEMFAAAAEELESAQVSSTLETSLLIEDFMGDWRKEWFTYRPEQWGVRTHKIYDKAWQAPTNGTLSLEVLSKKQNKLVIGLDNYVCESELVGGEDWQTLEVAPSDFKNVSGVALEGWGGLRELRLAANEILRERQNGKNVQRQVGAPWFGPDPEFRNLRWIPE